MNLSIRPARQSDMPELLRLAEAFVVEAEYGFTFDALRSAKSLRALFDVEGVHLVVADFDGVLAGGFLLQFERLFTAELWGYLQLFYVERSRRGAVVGRKLAAEVARLADAGGVSHLFTSATGGISPAATGHFVNLLGKVGFSPLGPVLLRVAP